MKALFLAAALLTSLSASAETWRRHTCTVEMDQTSFRMDIYSTWDRCIGIDAGMSHKAKARTIVKGMWRKVTGEETESHFDSYYQFKNIHSKYPGKVLLTILAGENEDNTYVGEGTYFPKTGNALSLRLTCRMGNEAGTSCED
ncbi:MAG TPA: hypothetical protein VNJ01_08715 [Bacteriovoracaceae bacterium]|nr:hypothetical protein [Bacteriovoracaceae bacterium]